MPRAADDDDYCYDDDSYYDPGDENFESDLFLHDKPDFGAPHVLECNGYDRDGDGLDAEGRSVLQPVPERTIRFYQRHVRMSLLYSLRAHENAATAYEAACISRRLLLSRTAEVDRLAMRAACEAYNAHIAAQNAHTAYVWRNRRNAKRAVRHAEDACLAAARAANKAEAALRNSHSPPPPVAP